MRFGGSLGRLEPVTEKPRRDRALPEGHQYHGHFGNRQRRRVLRRRWRIVEKMLDSAIARARLTGACKEHKDPELALWFLGHTVLLTMEALSVDLNAATSMVLAELKKKEPDAPAT